jgi:uncharacterized membrane protein YoaK (UPF0700 family)
MSSTTAAQPGPGSLRALLPRVLLVMTLATGVIDAVSYLGLGRVFSANMTGNVVLLGFGIAGTGGLPVIAPLVSAFAFVLGAAAGGRLGVATTDQRRRQITITLATEVVLIVLAGTLAAILNVRPDHVTGDAIIALLAFAMGVRNTTVRALGVPDLTTTVLTMTLTGLSADSRLAGGSGKGTVRRSAAVVSMLVGAIVGALAVKSSLVLALLVAAFLALVALVGYLRFS